MAEFRFTYDPDAKAAYVYLSGTPVSRTVEMIEGVLYADIDDAGELVGIEALQLTESRLPTLFKSVADLLDQSADTLGDDADRLLRIA